MPNAICTRLFACQRITHMAPDQISRQTHLTILLFAVTDKMRSKELAYTNSGIDAFNPEGERGELIHILQVNRVNYLKNIGKITDALREIDQMWDDIDVIDQPKVVLNIYELRADLCIMLGMYEEAIEYAKEGLKKARACHQYEDMFYLFTSLGHACLRDKRLDDAEENLKMALNLSQYTKNRGVLLSTYTYLGSLYLQQDKYKEAENALSEAIQIGDAHKSAVRLVDTYITYGELFHKQGNYQKASGYHRKAIELARKCNNRQKEHKAMFLLSKSLEKTDEKEFNECMKNMYKLQEQIYEEEEHEIAQSV